MILHEYRSAPVRFVLGNARISLLRPHARCFIRSAEHVNRGRVHADQVACADPANDNGLDSIETIHAHYLRVRKDGDATPHARAGSAQRPAKAPYQRHSRGTNHDQHPHAAASGVNRSRDCAGITGNDHQIHSLAHRVDTERGNPCTTIGPLSALRKASICRNSTAFNRRGFNSVCPAGAAGARL